MQHIRRDLVLAAILCASALSAQGQRTISPEGLGPVYGGNTTGYPWGYSAYPNFRYQQIHDDLAGKVRVFLAMAIRRKESGAAHTAVSPTLQLDLSTAAVGSQQSTSTFVSNHGSNRVVAMASKVVNFPAANPPTNGLPAPFTYVMMLDQPYIHSGAGGICWEVLMTANAYGGATMSFDLATNGLARSVVFGTGCGGVTLAGTATTTALGQTGAGWVPNSNVYLLLGADNEKIAGLPLPLDLTSINAAGCWLYTDPLVTVGLVADGAGGIANSFPMSGLPANLTVNMQLVGPSPAVPLGLAFSNGLYQTPSAPRTFMRNWISNTTSATGSLQLTYALVTEFS